MFRPPVSKSWDELTEEEQAQRLAFNAAYEAGVRQAEREGPFHMVINREIWTVVLKHLATPGGVDGSCVCADEESIGEHGADHLINELVKAFGLPWKRQYSQDIDGMWPPAWCEGSERIRRGFNTQMP